MASSSSLMHPVRLRIVQTLLGDDALTTHQLHERLPDVPIATLYRHVSHLVSHDLVEVASARQVRGASEKTYRLAEAFVNPSAEELDALSKEELLTAFTVFASGLIRDFGDYLEVGDPKLHADRVSFAQASFWADDDEIDAFGSTIMAALERLLGNGPTPGRRRRTLTTVIIPREEANGSQDGHQEPGAAE
ncbi:helix-turn-helix domain-containing protein [Propioniciclava flava]|uniref:DNA-binding protein n=1 Tax=Propioniciclava flava TaxID=2072026 RepID=A0A4Q2EH25_9ACTN|nr:helix-turn-helix domain-containing protein [Propioniciclava flava]RXW32609.1 DNA-binding protein [Propioniciclava flava]